MKKFFIFILVAVATVTGCMNNSNTPYEFRYTQFEKDYINDVYLIHPEFFIDSNKIKVNYVIEANKKLNSDFIQYLKKNYEDYNEEVNITNNTFEYTDDASIREKQERSWDGGVIKTYSMIDGKFIYHDNEKNIIEYNYTFSVKIKSNKIYISVVVNDANITTGEEIEYPNVNGHPDKSKPKIIATSETKPYNNITEDNYYDGGNKIVGEIFDEIDFFITDIVEMYR